MPDNVEANPIYSYGKNFEPITFPSERDVPPKHVRPEEAEQAASASVGSRGCAGQRVGWRRPPFRDPSTSWELTTDDELETQPLRARRTRRCAGRVSARWQKISSAQAAPEAQVQAAQRQSRHRRLNRWPRLRRKQKRARCGGENSSATAEHETKEVSRPSFVARVRGWMDMMSPSSDEPAETKTEEREQHWMSSLAAPAVSNESLQVESTAISAPLNVTEVENPVKTAEAEALAETLEPAVVELLRWPEIETAAPEVRAEQVQEERFEALRSRTSTQPPAIQKRLARAMPAARVTGRIKCRVPEAFDEPGADSAGRSRAAGTGTRAGTCAAEGTEPFITAETPDQFEVAAQTRWTDALQAFGRGAAERQTAERTLATGTDDQRFARAAVRLPSSRNKNPRRWRSGCVTAPIKRSRAPNHCRWKPQRPSRLRRFGRKNITSRFTTRQPFADQPEPTIFESEPVQAARARIRRTNSDHAAAEPRGVVADSVPDAASGARAGSVGRRECFEFSRGG